MKSFIAFILTLTFSINATGGFCQSGKPVIRFGLITDIQYADAETRGSRFYRNSLPKLDSCVNDLNMQQVEFTINMGDIVDRNPNDLDAVLALLSRLDKKIYNTTGNHDYNGITDNAQLYKRLHMPAAYYSFKKGKWVFIMLNTNEVGSYSNVTGTWKEQELKSMLDQIKANKGRNATDYNGGISSQQLQWLDQVLKKAQRKRQHVLVFSHHPIGCAEGLNALNDKEILAIIEKYKCVKALIAGHHHTGAFCETGSLPVIVAEGMVETADKNAYGVVELFPNRLVLKGAGRMTSRTINF